MVMFKTLAVTKAVLILSNVSKVEKEWIKKRRRRRDMRKRRRKTKQNPAAEVALVSLSSQVWTGDH